VRQPIVNGMPPAESATLFQSTPEESDMTTTLDTQDANPEPVAKKKRGFATMDAARIREFARRGGVAAHRSGRAHQFTSEEARIAGRKGGVAAHLKAAAAAEDRKNVS
jgi:uncharacterized protein